MLASSVVEASGEVMVSGSTRTPWQALLLSV